MKKTFRCPKCGHNHILYVLQVPDQRGAQETRGASIARVKIKAGGLFGGERLTEAGSLTAMVCRQCGYTEFYTAEPASIPVDNEFVHEMVGPETVS